MAEPAAQGWPALAVTQLDEGLPLDSPGDYRSLLDWQVLAPAGALHPSVAALNAGLPAPAARAVQQAQGEPQTLPDIIETYFAPLLSRRRGLLVFEPRGQRREERQARKRQRSAAQRDDDVRYTGNSYAGRYNFLPSGPSAVPVIAKRTTTQTRTRGGLEHQFSAHEVRRVVPNPGAVVLRVAELHLEDNGVAELRLDAGGEAFSGSTKIVLVTGLPDATVAGSQLQLSGRYPVNPSGCRKKLARAGSHFRIKLPKKAAAAAAAAIQDAVQRGLVSVREDYVAEEPLIVPHLMLTGPAPAEQPQAPPGGALVPALMQVPLPQQQQQQQQQEGVDDLDLDGLLHQVLNGDCDAHLLGAGGAVGPGEQHFSLLTVGGEQPAAGRGSFAARAFVVQGGAEVTGELYSQGHMVVSDARKKENIRAFDEADKSLRIVTELCSYIFEYKGTDAQRLGLLAQQVRSVLEQHDAQDLNIVKADAQGSLAVDFAALQTLLMSALKQVHADTAELRRTQSAFQLMVMGRLETMAAAQQAGGGGLEVLLRTGSGASGVSGVSGASGGDAGLGAGAGGGLAACPSLARFLGPDEDYDMACSENGEGSEEEAPPAGEQPDEGELRGMSEVQAAHWLMARLCEQAGAQKLYLKLAGDLSLAALWETYQAALAAPPELTNDGTAQRTLGGVFIKLAKKRIQAEKMRQKAAAQGAGPVQLRGYQQRLVAVARRGGNHIFVAPTNSGKTAVALEHAAHVLSRNPAAKVVFEAPTVALATQQAAAFCGHPSFGPRGFRVGCFTSDKPIAPRDWRKALEDHDVIVLTPQILVNALDAGEAHFSQIALLVLDECHHATGKHAVNQMLRHYHASRERTQILGLTATPTSKDSLAATLAGMRELARNLAAEYVVVDEKDEELLRAVPNIEQAEVVVQLEAANDGFARRLGAFVVAAVERLREGLGLPDLPGLPQQVVAMLQAGGWSAAALRWTRSIAERLQAAVLDGLLSGSSPAMHDATSALGLVRAATAALALVSDVGFEAAVRHLSGEYFTAASKAAPPDGTAVGPITAALLAQLAEEVVEPHVLEGTFSGAMTRHPKFQALLTCLAGAAQQRDSWHAIVFARTLAALLQGRPELPGMQVHPLMGHGDGAAAGGGMSSKQQQAALEAFRQPGRQLLVSTAAGEEGIDVPRCELVVRYAATQTGRERLQSAGRARKHGSRFVEIIGATASELALMHKSRREEEHLRTALQGLAL